MKHVLILGAGFGGAYAYRRLYRLLNGNKDVRVTIINEKDYFWFVPLAHEVATGNLSISSVTYSLRSLPQNGVFDFIKAVVDKVDLDKQTVSINTLPIDGQPAQKEEIHYDYLISALGSETSYFGVDGAKEYSLPVKSLDDVRRIKNTVLARFEEVGRFTSEDEKRSYLRFVITGGGPTGVELAGELSDLLSDEVARAYPLLGKYASVVLLQRGDKLLPGEGGWFSREAEKVLLDRGVDVRFNSPVIKIEEDKVYVEGGEIKTHTVFWTVGVVAKDIEIKGDLGIDRHPKSNRVKVTPFLSIDAYKNVFVIGDQAWVEDKESLQPYPMRAQFAVRQGNVVAENVASYIKGGIKQEFAWRDRGFVVSLGKGKALVRVFGMQFSGPVAWWIYRTAYLPQILGWRARLSVLVEWTLNLFLPRDLTEI